VYEAWTPTEAPGPKICQKRTNIEVDALKTFLTNVFKKCPMLKSFLTKLKKAGQRDKTTQN